MAQAVLTIDTAASGDQASASTNLSTRPFATTTSNELLLAFVSTDYLGGTNTSVTSVSGAGLTWTRVLRTNVQAGASEIWRAFAPTTLSAVTVTATLSQQVVASITVVSFSGVDTSGTNGSGAIGATASANAAAGTPSASVTTTRDGSWVLGVGNDFDNAIARTPGATQTIVHQYLAPVGDTYWVQRQNATTPASGTSVPINDTAPTGDRYNLSVVEVLPALGGATTYSISGSLTPATGGSGATVTLTQGTTTIATVTTDGSGNYSVANLLNGTYTATPSKAGYTFSPASRVVTISGANVSAVNFSATSAATYSISGSVSPAASGSGTTLTLTQGTTTIATAPADASGNFSFANLANGTYTVTPSKTGYEFNPSNRTVTIASANVTGVNFTAVPAPIYSIAGMISPVGSASGATVTLTQGTTTIAIATVDGSGNYTFSNLPNGSYTVTPSKTGYVFSPSSRTVTIANANISAVNFTVSAASTFSIAGSITPAATAAGATVSLTQGTTAVATATVDASGNFAFANVTNGSYTVTPGKVGYTFGPVNQAVTVVGSNVTGVNFTVVAHRGGIAYIQGATSGSESTAAAMSATFSAPNTTGNLLVVTGTAARPSATLTISDSAGNTYGQVIGPVTDPAQAVSLYVWYVPYCKGGPNTVTITPSQPDALEIHIAEFSGADPTSPVDQYSTATGTGTAVSSGTRTTQMSGELVYGYSFVGATSSSTGIGFTGSSYVDGDWDEYQIQSAPGSVAATFTQPTSMAWLAAMVTFKPALQQGNVTDWLTYGHDPMRRGTAAGELTITKTSVPTLALKWAAGVDGKVTAQPLFIGSTVVVSQTHDVVIAATANNSVYALDAATGATLWQRHFNAPSGAGAVPGGFGIEATPVIDPSTGRIYTVTDDGILRTLALTDGSDAATAVTVIGANSSTNSVYGGLNLVGGRLYIATSSNGNDDAPWWGRVVELDVTGTSPAIVTTFKVVPSIPAPNGGGGIWGYGGVSVDPPSGSVYAATAANGVSGGSGGQGYTPYAGRMIAFDGGLNTLGSYEPPHPSPCVGDPGSCDMDFGSTPTLYLPPNCPLMAAAVNKDGHLYALSTSDLASSATSSLQALTLNIAYDGPGRGGIIGLPAYWPLGDMLFVTDGLDPSLGQSIPGVNAGVVGLQVGPSCKAQVAWSVDWSGKSGGPALTADNLPPSPATIAGGVVFVGSGVNGSVHAFDASTGTELWNSGASIPGGATFVAPIVAKGALYTASWNGFAPADGGTVRAFAPGRAPPPPTVYLGDQNVESIIDSSPKGSAEAFQATASASGNVGKLTVYLDPMSTASSVIVGLYSDSNGHPGQLLGRGSLAQPLAGAWNSAAVPAITVTAGTRYWIAVLAPSGSGGSIFFRDANGPCISESTTSTSVTDLPASWVIGQTWPSCPLSAYGSAP